MVASADQPGLRRRRRGGWLARLVARPGVQDWAGRLPFGARLARRDGAEIFDVLQGFVSAQVLSALVELGLLERLLDGAEPPDVLGAETGIAPDRMAALLQAGAALGLLRRRRDGAFGLARKGAAILGVPGLTGMIRHNRAFYDDMADPVALLRGEAETQMAHFWPYVLGQTGDIPPEVSARYSDLMSRSQRLVAQDTLRAVSLNGVTRLMDVGGGAGVFLAEALRRHRGLQGVLFDLPGVMPLAEAELGRAGLADRVALSPGSFRDDLLPRGADAISLVRVLYDHDDATVRALLAAALEALPPGGRLIISEPMSGGARPDRATDVYFSFYTMSMGTGRVRSARRIGALCKEAGFVGLEGPHAARSFITSVVVARRPDSKVVKFN
ncbi:methyltransferase [Mameliella sp. CS4]|uniref:methyltransferase n=1 Tax=Mameliella sp. CS4 TaxID=2862329 RepID=UPI00351D79E2